MFKNRKGIKIGIGVDVEQIARFEGLDRTHNASFLGKIFTKKELAYCFSKKNPAQHLAARFAGKEATIKALSDAREANLRISDYRKIEIIKNARGGLKVNITGISVEIHMSLSHCGDTAIAFVIVV